MSYTRKKNTKTRQELNDEARALKKKKKHKGRPSGSRHNVEQHDETSSSSKKASDPRLGSKKLIPLGSQGEIKQQKRVQLTLEQQLEQLESDDLLDQYLQRVENGEELTPQEQAYVDDKLDQIDILLKKLNIDNDDEDEDIDDNYDEDIMSLLR